MTISAQTVHPTTGQPMRLRSAVSSGKRAFALGGDGRGAWTLRWLDLVDMHAADLGGPDILSEAQMSLIRRASAMECQLEVIEAKFSEESPDEWELTEVHARISGALRRLHETLGIKRVPRNVNDDDFLQRHFDRPFRPAPNLDDDDGSVDDEKAASEPPSPPRGAAP